MSKDPENNPLITLSPSIPLSWLLYSAEFLTLAEEGSADRVLSFFPSFFDRGVLLPTTPFPRHLGRGESRNLSKMEGGGGERGL